MHTPQTTVATQTPLADFSNGLRWAGLWLLLGWRDVQLRFRRAALGTLWIPISLAVVVMLLGPLYSQILQQDLFAYMPYIAAGFAVWYLISSLVTDGCMVFVANAGAIKEINAPKTIYIFRMLWRNTIIFAHNLSVYVIVMLLAQQAPGWAVLWAIPALALIILNGGWVAILFGILNARFRDTMLFVNSVMRLMFFVTPVLWQAQRTGVPQWLVDFNPFHYFVDILLQPLLGTVPDATTWAVVIGFTLVGWAVALITYTRQSDRVTYWV